MAAQPITRKRLHDYIDAMPDYGLPIVEPLLAHFADELLFIPLGFTDPAIYILTYSEK